jgi:HlyD family secretion protein
MKIKKLMMLSVLLAIATSCSVNGDRSDAYGNFEATEVMVSAEAAGRLLAFDAGEGQRMEAGAVVGIIDTADLVLKKRQLLAQKDAVSARAANVLSQIRVFAQQKENLEKDRARVENLLKDNAATQKQLDDIIGSLRLIDRQVESVQTQNATVLAELKVLDSQLEQVEEGLKKCRITSPLAGTVLDLFAEAGEVTAPGKPLFKIANLDDMRLKVYVSGEQLPGIRLGQEVEVLVDRDKKTNRSLSGKVSWISSGAEFTPKIIQTKEERVNLVYAVKVDVKNDGSLKIGMPAEVNFR